MPKYTETPKITDGGLPTASQLEQPFAENTGKGGLNATSDIPATELRSPPANVVKQGQEIPNWDATASRNTEAPTLSSMIGHGIDQAVNWWNSSDPNSSNYLPSGSTSKAELSDIAKASPAGSPQATASAGYVPLNTNLQDSSGNTFKYTDGIYEGKRGDDTYRIPATFPVDKYGNPGGGYSWSSPSSQSSSIPTPALDTLANNGITYPSVSASDTMTTGISPETKAAIDVATPVLSTDNEYSVTSYDPYRSKYVNNEGRTSTSVGNFSTTKNKNGDITLETYFNPVKDTMYFNYFGKGWKDMEGNSVNFIPAANKTNKKK